MASEVDLLLISHDFLGDPLRWQDTVDGHDLYTYLTGNTEASDGSTRYHLTLQAAARIVEKAPRTPKNQRLLSWLHAKIQGASGLLLH